MKKKLRNLGVLILVLLAIRQSGVWIEEYTLVGSRQKQMVREQNMDPSVFFYTESVWVQEAEVEIRQRLREH